MTGMSLVTPGDVGTRDLVRGWLTSALADHDPKGEVVEIDCSALKTPTPSLMDELLKILILERDVSRVQLLNASERASSLAKRSAQNRHIEDRVQIETSPERTGLLQRIFR